MASEPQILANRANAQLSSGPSSVEGKKISSRNAEDLGIYIPSFQILNHENGDEYGAYLRASFSYWRPADQLQIDLVHEIVNAQWEIWRYRAAEPEIIHRFALKNAMTDAVAYIELLSDPKTNQLKYLLRIRGKAEDKWAARVKDLQRLQKASGVGGPTSGSAPKGHPLVAGVPQGTANPLCDEIGFVPKLRLIGGESTDSNTPLDPDIGR